MRLAPRVYFVAAIKKVLRIEHDQEDICAADGWHPCKIRVHPRIKKLCLAAAAVGDEAQGGGGEEQGVGRGLRDGGYLHIVDA